MTLDEAKLVLVRAREGGYFDAAVMRYAEARPNTQEEAEAYRDVYRLARALLGTFELPRVTVGATGPLNGVETTMTISDAYWRDHVMHGRWPYLLDVDEVPEDLLDAWAEKAHPIRSRFVNATAKETT